MLKVLSFVPRQEEYKYHQEYTEYYWDRNNKDHR